jgi:hypothetical protein
VENNNLEQPTYIFALRRPNVAPLWHGIAHCGRTKTIEAIIPFLETLGTPILARPIPEEASWIESPQLFMGLCG